MNTLTTIGTNFSISDFQCMNLIFMNLPEHNLDVVFTQHQGDDGLYYIVIAITSEKNAIGFRMSLSAGDLLLDSVRSVRREVDEAIAMNSQDQKPHPALIKHDVQ